jgi:ABC-type nitrate/sulfonate/bicarbonate transport system substrate-binding protein
MPALLTLVGVLLALGANCAPAPPQTGGAPSGARPAATAGSPATAGNAAPLAAAGQAAPSTQRPRPLTTVTLTIPQKGMPFLPFHVAKELGFDQMNGLDLEVQVMPGQPSVAALISGGLDFSASAGALVNGRLNGAPVAVVMTGIDRSTYALYAKPAIQRVEDLRGQTLAVDAVGGSQYSELGLALEKLGMRLDEARVVGLPAPSTVAGMESGAVDAAVVAPPDDVRLEQLGLGFHRLLNLGDYVVGLNGGLGTAAASLQSRPEMVDAMVLTSLMGLRYVKENRAGTIPLMPEFVGLNADTAAEVYDRTVGAYSDGRSTPAARTEIVEHAAAIVKPAEAVPASAVFDFGPLDRAETELRTRAWRPN